MTFDPFSDPEPQPEPTNVVALPTKENIRTVTNVSSSDNTDKNYVTAIFKTDNSYGAGSLSVRGENLADLQSQLEDPSFGKVLELIAKADKAFKALHGGSAPAPVKPEAKPGQPPQSQDNPSGSKEFCAHGEMVYKSGTGKNNRKWQAYDCPQRQCDRKWVN